MRSTIYLRDHNKASVLEDKRRKSLKMRENVIIMEQ